MTAAPLEVGLIGLTEPLELNKDEIKLFNLSTLFQVKVFGNGQD